MFRKILCPIDFSAGSQHAMQLAARMAGADADLVLAHAWHLSPLAYSAELPPAALEGLVSDADRGLATAFDELRKLGARRVTTTLLRGVPWDQIVETARGDAAIDLIVMGTHGRTGLARVLLGSVTEKVVRHAPCSVLTARPGREVTTFGRVLCPVDFSDESRHALALAAELAAPDGAGITLLHVVELLLTYSRESPTLDMFEVNKGATHLLEEWAAELRAKVRVPVTTQIQIGSPGARVLAVLEDGPPFDLVVVGSRGRTGIRRALLGSVAEKIVRHAACPVLVARDRQ